MDRNGISILSICVCAMLAATLLASIASEAMAQHPIGQVYNPLTGQYKPNRGQLRRRTIPQPISDSAEDFVQPTSHSDPSDFGDDFSTQDCIGCGDSVFNDAGCCGSTDCSSCTPGASFYTGFEATFVKPRFENNVAFTVMEADGASFESFSETEFDYDLEFTPRVFLGWQYGNGIGMRVTWWQFDHEAATASANPPANGFGAITHPTFGTVNISSVIPTDAFSATTDLNAYIIDFEATKQTSFCSWDLGVGCGIRYAHTEQSYRAQLRNTNDVLRGQIDYQHSLEGFGPTISLDVYRPFSSQSGIFCKARGSVLFGDGESRLTAVEDADLTTPFNTTRATSRDDLLSIGEVQVGYRWKDHKTRGKSFRPFCSIAMEGQIWNGAGNATSEDGTLGFFGFNTGVGIEW